MDGGVLWKQLNKNQTKKKLKDLVAGYKALYPEEFENFKIGMRDKRNLLQDRKYGEASQSDVIDRVMGEVPENLYIIIKMKLDEDEIKWFHGELGYKQGETLFNEGPRWFFTTFKEFRSAEEI